MVSSDAQYARPCGVWGAEGGAGVSWAETAGEEEMEHGGRKVAVESETELVEKSGSRGEAEAGEYGPR